MTTYFISRHPGAKAWVQQQLLTIDKWVNHFDLSHVQAGDTVIGTLPVNLAAVICARGATYWHLSMTLPRSARGTELSISDMDLFGATLEPFHVVATNNKNTEEGV